MGEFILLPSHFETLIGCRFLRKLWQIRPLAIFAKNREKFTSGSAQWLQNHEIARQITPALPNNGV